MKRLILIFPTVILITVIAFLFSKNTPQDQASSLLALRGLEADVTNQDMYDKVYKELELDLPLFYLSIVPSHFPRTINKYSDESTRDLYERLLKSGIYYKDADWLINSIGSINMGKTDLNVLKDQFEAVHDRPIKKNKFYWPKIYWNGSSNQYHNWLEQMFFNGFGPSVIDGEISSKKVSKALKWTLSFTLIDFVLSIILSLLFGYYIALNANGRFQKLLQSLLYFIYAIPVFWLATMMVIYFTNDNFGSWTNIFPSVGVDIYPGKPTFQQIWLNANRLILPVLCLTLHSLAYVTRFVSQSLNDEFQKDYVQLAYSKGLDKREVLKKHIFPNAWIPIVTVFVSAFASAFAGSVVIEVIFNIPGIGRLLFNSISLGDWNVVMCILVVASFVTILSYIIGDMLYYYFTPKMKAQKV